MPATHTRFALPLFLALVLMTACATRPAAEPDGDEREPARVTVINRSFERVSIYVYRGAEGVRLGAVSPGVEETFNIPVGMMSGLPRLRFTAETVGRHVLASVVETISPGVHLELIVR